MIFSQGEKHELAAVSVMFFTASSIIFCSYLNGFEVWRLFCFKIVLDTTMWEANIESLPSPCLRCFANT